MAFASADQAEQDFLRGFKVVNSSTDTQKIELTILRQGPVWHIENFNRALEFVQERSVEPQDVIGEYSS